MNSGPRKKQSRQRRKKAACLFSGCPTVKLLWRFPLLLFQHFPLGLCHHPARVGVGPGPKRHPCAGDKCCGGHRPIYYNHEPPCRPGCTRPGARRPGALRLPGVLGKSKPVDLPDSIPGSRTFPFPAVQPAFSGDCRPNSPAIRALAIVAPKNR